MNNKILNSTIDISNHLINFSLEEIKGLIYVNKEKSVEEINKIILKKISWTFSQDIIINIYSAFQSKYNKVISQIIEYYNLKPKNFDEFLIMLKDNSYKTYHKNIIFTFSYIYENIDYNYIALKIINNNDYEKTILNFIEYFFHSEQKTIMIIKIKKNLCYKHLNHIQNLIDNYIVENNINLIDPNKPKYIIFIIHLNRIINKSEKEINNMIISHLSSYNQIFIDNLKGDNISIIQFYNLKSENIFNMSIKNEKNEIIDFFNKDLEFENIFFEGFMSFSYKFLNEVPKDLKELTEENYSKIAIKKLKTNEIEFYKLIQEKIIGIICLKSMKNIINEVITDIKYKQKGIDLISNIKDYIRYELLKYVIKFIFRAENNGILTSILFNHNKNDRLKKCYKIISKI